MRAEKRIRKNMSRVLWLCFNGYTLPDVARLPGYPGLRTMRTWCRENLNGFGRMYHLLMRERAIDRIQAGVMADYRQIRAKVERKNRTKERIE
jgi:hypothetical protein